MKKNIQTSLLFFGLCVSVGFAQAVNPPDPLVSLVRQSLDYYPKIKEQQQAATISAYRTRVAQSQNLPVLSLDASYTRIDPVGVIKLPLPGNEVRTQFQPNNNYNTALTLNQTIWDFGRTAANVEKSRADETLANTGVESLKHTLAYQVAAFYYGIVFLQKSIEVQKAQIQLLRENEKVIADKIKDGDEIDYNLIATQVRYKNAETRLVDLQTQLDKQYILLNTVTGKDVRGTIPADAEFVWNATEAELNQAQTGNWDLKLAQNREQIAARDLGIAQRGTLPTLGFNGSAGFKNGIVPEIDRFRFNTLAGVRFLLPIYSGHRAKQQIEIAKLNQKLSQYTTETQQLTLKSDVEQAQNDLKAAQRKLEMYARQVQQAQYAVKLANTRYQNGVITNLDLLTSQTALEESQLGELQFKYQLVLAQLQLGRLAGSKFW